MFVFVKPFSFVAMASEVAFESLTNEEPLNFTSRVGFCCSNEFVSDLRDIQKETGVRLDGFDKFCACVASIQRSLLESTPFSETLWKYFEKSLLIINHQLNDLRHHDQKDLVFKNMEPKPEQDCEMVDVKILSCMCGINFKTYDTREESFRQIGSSK